VEVRLLLHHEKNQIRIDVVLVCVLENQTVEARAARAPAAFFLSGARDDRRVFEFDAIDTSTLEENRHTDAFVPNAGRRLTRAVSFNACAAFQIDPGWTIERAVVAWSWLSDGVGSVEVIVVVRRGRIRSGRL